MKEIHEILKARKKNLQATHTKKPPQTDFHSPISGGWLFRKKEPDTEKKVKQAPEASVKPQSAYQSTYKNSQLPSMRFFRPKKIISTEKFNSKKEEGEGDSGIEKLDKERIARLRELLNDVINHPGTLTPQMFWVLFMNIAPHFSLATAGCVRVSALFWLMLSYIKAKSKNKRRKLKEKLTEAAELLEKDDDTPMVRVRRR